MAINFINIFQKQNKFITQELVQRYWFETSYKQTFLNIFEQNTGHHMCVTTKESDNFIYFARCDPDDTKQQWDWDLVNEEPLQRANNNPEGPGDDPPELDYIQ